MLATTSKRLNRTLIGSIGSYFGIQKLLLKLHQDEKRLLAVLLPGKSHGRGSLVGCSPWGREESDTTERIYFHFSLSCIGEGNGNPLQCSCLENPRDGGAWWTAVYGVPQSRTRLKLLSSSSSSSLSLTCSSFSPAFRMMYSAYKLNKQGGQYTALTYSFPNLEPCLVLTVASWSAYRFLRRQVRWSGILISWRIVQEKVSLKEKENVLRDEVWLRRTWFSFPVPWDQSSLDHLSIKAISNSWN